MASSLLAVTLCSVPVRKESADEELALAEAKVSSKVYPSLERVPGKQNWVDKAGGLPSYIERIAKHLHYERGHSIGSAIAMAVNTVKKWAATGRNHNGGKLKAQTVTKAAKAVAEWEAKKLKGKAKSAAKDVKETVMPSAEDLVSVGREANARLVLVEGLLLSLQGTVVHNRAGAVKSAQALLESDDGEVQIQIGGGDADRDEMIDARIKLSQQAAELRSISEAAMPRVSKGDTGGQVLHAQNRLNTLGYKVKPDGEFGPVTDTAVKAFQSDHKLEEDGVIGPDTTVSLRGADPEDAARRRDERTQEEGEDPVAEEEELSEDEVGGANAADEAHGETVAGMLKDDPAEDNDEEDEEVLAEEDEDEEVLVEDDGGGKLRDLMKGAGVGHEKGDKQVEDMQSLLGSVGYKVGDDGADGRYGPDTEKAVKGMQRKHGLKADGVFGQQTRRLLARVAKRAAGKKQDAGEMKEASLQSMRMPQLAETLRGVDVAAFVNDEQAPLSGQNSRYNRIHERLTEAVGNRQGAQRSGNKEAYGRWLGRERHYRTKLEEAELQEAYVGWEKLVAKLMTQGKSKEEAERIAASIGQKKYGKAKFQKAATLGKKASLVEAAAKADTPSLTAGPAGKVCPECGMKVSAKQLKEGMCGGGHSLKKLLAKKASPEQIVERISMMEGKYRHCRDCGMKLSPGMLHEGSCGLGHSVKDLLEEAATVGYVGSVNNTELLEAATPPNLRDAADTATSCGTCVYFDGDENCEAFDVTVAATQVCDEWGNESSL